MACDCGVPLVMHLTRGVLAEMPFTAPPGPRPPPPNWLLNHPIKSNPAEHPHLAFKSPRQIKITPAETPNS